MLRSDPVKVRAWQDRSRRNLPRGKGLRQRSPSKAALRSAVQAARRIALARDGHRCQAAHLVPDVACAGRLEGHHVRPRSTAPEAVADPENIVGVCSIHHAWVGDHPVAARAVGLHGHAGDDPAALALLRRESAPGASVSAFGGSPAPDHCPPGLGASGGESA